jgi:site-specific DNA recombinase
MRRAKRTQADQGRVIGYVRVSTEEQSLGPEAQREALARWCAANGAELVAVYQDLGVSGGAALEKRPGLLCALAALAENHAGALLVAKRDRLARDVVLCALVERLAERSGARILSADGTGNGSGPEALLLRGLVDLFAQYERALIRTRTAAALSVKRSRGERTGALPYGYQLSADGLHLEENPAEQTAYQRLQALRASGLSLRAIAERLNGESVPARGSRWYPTTVARLVERLAA